MPAIPAATGKIQPWQVMRHRRGTGIIIIVVLVCTGSYKSLVIGELPLPVTSQVWYRYKVHVTATALCQRRDSGPLLFCRTRSILSGHHPSAAGGQREPAAPGSPLQIFQEFLEYTVCCRLSCLASHSCMIEDAFTVHVVVQSRGEPPPAGAPLV